jgi:hypothetical protein
MVAGFGLGLAGALWFIFFFVMSVMTTAAGKINSMTFGTWAISALGLISTGLGAWLILTI